MAQHDNLADQFARGVQDALERQDLSGLRRAVENTANAAGQGVRHLQTQFQEGMERAQREELERRERERVQARYGSAGGLRVTGVTMAVLGWIMAFSFAVSAVSVLVFPPMWPVALFCAALALVFGRMALAGQRRFALANRYDVYRRYLGSRPWCSLDELKAQVGLPVSRVRDDLRELIGAGLFRQGHLDPKGRVLFVDNSAWDEWVLTGGSSVPEQVTGAPEPATAVEAVVEDVEVQEAPAAPFEIPEELDERIRPVVEEGVAYLERIERANALIDDVAVSAKVDRIEAVLAKIFEFAADHPDTADDLERLMNYYLPTTVRLLDTYDDLEEQPVQGSNIASSRKEIEGMLDTLAQAYENLLDDIFRDTAWDVSADISVLQTMLAQEGLIDERPNGNPSKPKE